MKDFIEKTLAELVARRDRLNSAIEAWRILDLEYFKEAVE